MSPPQDCFPLAPAEGISSPLVRPNPLEVNDVVAPPGRRGRPRANYLKPAQQKSCLGSDPHHWQGPSQKGGSQSQLCLLCPHLPPPPLLRAGHPHPWDGQMVNQRVEIVRPLPKCTHHHSFHLAQSSQLGLNWSCGALSCAAVLPVCVPGLGEIISVTDSVMDSNQEWSFYIYWLYNFDDTKLTLNVSDSCGFEIVAVFTVGSAGLLVCK